MSITAIPPACILCNFADIMNTLCEVIVLMCLLMLCDGLCMITKFGSDLYG